MGIICVHVEIPMDVTGNKERFVSNLSYGSKLEKWPYTSKRIHLLHLDTDSRFSDESS